MFEEAERQARELLRQEHSQRASDVTGVLTEHRAVARVIARVEPTVRRDSSEGRADFEALTGDPDIVSDRTLPKPSDTCSRCNKKVTDDNQAVICENPDHNVCLQLKCIQQQPSWTEIDMDTSE